jgi:hypothetical protein
LPLWERRPRCDHWRKQSRSGDRSYRAYITPLGAPPFGAIVGENNRGQETAPTGHISHLWERRPRRDHWGKQSRSGDRSYRAYITPVGAPPFGAIIGENNRGQETAPTTGSSMPLWERRPSARSLGKTIAVRRPLLQGIYHTCGSAAPGAMVIPAATASHSLSTNSKLSDIPFDIDHGIIGRICL